MMRQMDYDQVQDVLKKKKQRFQNHRYEPLTQNLDGQTAVWRGFEPGQGVVYSFTVIIRPRTVVMTGDIYDLLLHPTGSDSIQSTWEWVKDSVGNLSYFSEKIPINMRETYEINLEIDEAIKVAVQRLEEMGEEGYDDDGIAKAQEELGYCDDIESIQRVFWDIFVDPETIPDLTTWNPQFLFQQAALMDMADKVPDIMVVK